MFVIYMSVNWLIPLDSIVMMDDVPSTESFAMSETLPETVPAKSETIAELSAGKYGFFKWSQLLIVEL